MNQIQAMRAFIRIAELSSFTRVADELKMSPSAVTRLISTLETHLKVRLLDRNTRNVSLTDWGKDYYVGCRAVLARLDELELNLAEAAGQVGGTLRIAASLPIVTSGLMRVLTGYMAQHPRVHFDVTTFDTRIDLSEGAFDVCFSEERRFSGPTLLSRRIAIVDDIVVASPTYLASRDAPATPDDLCEHSLLGVAHGLSHAWEFSDGIEAYRVDPCYALSATNGLVAREAALSHMGIALLQESLVADELARGTLIRLFDKFRINGGARDICLYYSDRVSHSRKIRSFIEYAASHYSPAQGTIKLRAVA